MLIVRENGSRSHPIHTVNHLKDARRPGASPRVYEGGRANAQE